MTGRVSDTNLVVAMLCLVAVVGLLMLGSIWLANRTEPSAREAALERQSAELVMSPDEIVTNVDPVEEGPDDDDPAECRPGPVEALAVDVADASVRWRATLPPPGSGHHAAFAVIDDGTGGHLALAVDEFLGDRPPSVAALDVATGEPRWQRFVDADTIHPTLLGPDSLVLSTEATEPGDEEFAAEEGFDREFMVVDGTGAMQSHPHAWSRDGTHFVPEIGTKFTYLSDLHPISPLLDDRAAGDRTIRAQERNEFGVPSVEAPDPLTGETVHINDLPLDDDFNIIGSDSSPGEPMQVGGDIALVVIGSSFGPNTRLAVFDRADGSLRWTLDHTRAAAIAGADIVYDKRNDEPPEAESTRDIHLVDGDNPDRERWSTALAVNSEGGNGFLGTVDGSPVFAVDDGSGAVDFLVIDDGEDVPELIDAAEGYGSGVSGRHHVDADVLAAATSDGVIVQLPDTDPVLVETDNAPTQVTRAGDVLLVVANHSTVGCD